MHRPVTIDFMAVSSYAKARPRRASAGAEGPRLGLDGRNVIIVEDIVDTGLTLSYLQEICTPVGPVAAHRLPAQQALAPEGRREGGLCRLHVEDRFVVGYGLDYAEQYRNLPTSPRSTEPGRPRRPPGPSREPPRVRQYVAGFSVSTRRSRIRIRPLTTTVRTSSRACVDEVGHGVVHRRLARRSHGDHDHVRELAASSEPMRSAMPTAAAPPMVAISSTVVPRRRSGLRR